MSKSTQEALQTNIFPAVDTLLRKGAHLSYDGFPDEFSFVASFREELYEWYYRYGYNLIFIDHRYSYLVPQGGLAAARTLSVMDMVTGQALFILFLDPSGLQTDGKFKISDFYNKAQLMMGDEGLEKILGVKRALTKEKLVLQVREALAKSLNKLERLGFVCLGKANDSVAIFRSIERFGEPVLALESDPESRIAEMVRHGRAEWLGEQQDAPDEDQDLEDIINGN
jgi:chromosome condensin MukBEF MukE localization factor